jgi:hypothetical protein
MTVVSKFYGHLVHFTAISYILWSFGIFCGLLVYFPVLVCLDQEKSGNPDAETGVEQCDIKCRQLWRPVCKTCITSANLTTFTFVF